MRRRETEERSKVRGTPRVSELGMAPLFLKTVTNLRACEEHLRTCKGDRSDGPPIEPAHGVRFTGDPETGLFNRKVYSPLFSGDAR